MSFEFERLKYVDKRSKLLLHGYMHESEKNLSLTIPDLITFICMFYYYQFEYFTDHGDFITLNDDRTIAQISDNISHVTAHSVYGNIKIDKSLGNVILLWTLKVITLANQDGMDDDLYLGIDSSNKSETHSDFSDYQRYTYYALGSDQAKWTNINSEPDSWNDGKRDNGYVVYGEYLKDGDIVRMEVNIPTESIKFYINDIDHGIAFDSIFSNDGTQFFHLAIAIARKGTKIQLTDFEMRQILK